ncbi:MAG: aminoglycoside 6'-acetyltransferase, partial [candidate division Zixibacteria bacterium SM23_81]
MQIIDFPADDTKVIHHTAAMLVKGFKDHWPDAWPDLDAALDEVQKSFGAGRINRIAIDDNGAVLGWVGATRQYHGNSWELHPMVVKLEHRGKGIGRALVADLEVQVRKQGGITIYLGTDDEDHMTSLGNTDLYPHVVEHIINIRNLSRHPY